MESATFGSEFWSANAGSHDHPVPPTVSLKSGLQLNFGGLQAGAAGTTTVWSARTVRLNAPITVPAPLEFKRMTSTVTGPGAGVQTESMAPPGMQSIAIDHGCVGVTLVLAPPPVENAAPATFKPVSPCPTMIVLTSTASAPPIHHLRRVTVTSNLCTLCLCPSPSTHRPILRRLCLRKRVALTGR